jgi:hypothetical protein
MRGRSGHGPTQYSFPVLDSAPAVAMGFVPLELDIEDLYEVQGCQRKESASAKIVPAHVLSVSSR